MPRYSVWVNWKVTGGNHVSGGALGDCALLPSLPGAAVAGIYRVAGKNMAPLEALVWGVGQTVLTLIISFSRILATL